MREAYQIVAAEAPWLLAGYALVFGLCVGSFLNVVIYRLPAGRSVVSPPSTCACGERIRWFDNVPVLSWILLRGRARCCGQRIAVRYPAVELLTGLVFMGIWLTHPPVVSLVFMLLAAMLIAGGFIDWDTMEIPDVFTVGGFAFALMLSILVPAIHGFDSGFWAFDALRALREALVGGLVGSAILLWIMLFAEVLMRKEAMGFGDVKLLGAIGGFCGWQGAVFTIFGGAVVGTVLAGIVLLAGAVNQAPPPPEAEAESEDSSDGESEQTHQPGALRDEDGLKMPFGPALGIAALVYVLGAAGPFDAALQTISEILDGQI